MRFVSPRDHRTEVFPPADLVCPQPSGLVCRGADLSIETLLEAYRKGLFPWDGNAPIPWFSPDPRAVMVPRAFRPSRSLAKLRRRDTLRVTFDQAFSTVIGQCAATPRKGQVAGTWITSSMIAAYSELHALGIGHSVEVWEGGTIVGGLYGLAMGRAFFGESMFFLRPDASKLALWVLCERLHHAGYAFVDCQQDTPHMRRMGTSRSRSKRPLAGIAGSRSR